MYKCILICTYVCVYTHNTFYEYKIKASSTEMCIMYIKARGMCPLKSGLLLTVGCVLGYQALDLSLFDVLYPECYPEYSTQESKLLKQNSLT